MTYLINIVVAILIFANLAVVSAEEGKLPDFQPDIKDKLEKMKNEKFELVQPLKESDMVKIIFAKEWLLQNDEDPSYDIIKVTFPADWSNKNVTISNESVLLKIPKRMLETEDLNEDPNQITVSYSTDMFKFENVSSEIVEKIEKEEEKREFQFDIPQNQISQVQEPYIVRAYYERDSMYKVTRVTGYIDPYSYYNTGETFTNYNEREIYLDGDADVIEFISEFSSSDGVTTKAYVWLAIWDGNVWTTPDNKLLLIDVTQGLGEVVYHLNIVNNVYNIWILDVEENRYYYYSYTDSDNPSSYIEWLVGSTELYTEGGISKYFITDTRPIRDDLTFADPDLSRPKVHFNWVSYYPGSVGDYVFINAWWDDQNRINTEHIASSYLRKIIIPCSGNTPPGERVEVLLDDVDVFTYFDLVIKCGNTSAVRLGPSYNNERLPPLSPLYEPIEFYEIWTTAKYQHGIDIVVYYDPPQGINEDTIKMLHYEGGRWKDVTTRLNTVANKVEGRVSSLSPFAIVAMHPRVMAGSGLNFFWTVILAIFLLIIGISRLNNGR